MTNPYSARMATYRAYDPPVGWWNVPLAYVTLYYPAIVTTLILAAAVVLGALLGNGPSVPVSAARTDSELEQPVLRDWPDHAEPSREPTVVAVRAAVELPSDPPRAHPVSRSYSLAEVEAIILSAAAEFGADAGLMLRMAHCESSMRPDNVNKVSGAQGLFQFLTREIFESNARLVGIVGDQRLDPVANARTAAAKIAREGTWAWEIDPKSVACWRPEK